MEWFSRLRARPTRDDADASGPSIPPSPRLGSRELRLSKRFESENGVMLYVHDGDVHAGKVAYAVCERFGIGHVLKVSVYAGYGKSGVGSGLIGALIRAFPALTWYTTWQQPSTVTFWRRMAEATGQPLVERQRCEHPHLTGRDMENVIGHSTPSASPEGTEAGT